MAWDMTVYRLSLLVVMMLMAAGSFTWVALRSRGFVAEVRSRFLTTYMVLVYGTIASGSALSTVVRLLTGNRDAAFVAMVAVWPVFMFAVRRFTPIKPQRSAGLPSDHMPER